MAGQHKKKNNHFVPQSYLVRFRSVSERQVGLYNLKSGRTIEIAPIKSQCARDYFYTKNPAFEDEFGKLEGRQNQLIARIIAEEYVPEMDSPDHHALLSLIMFQAGRTATSAAHQDHLANEFGKALLRKHLEREERNDLLGYLPKVNIHMPDGVIDSIGQHLAMYPLIGDMDVTLLTNNTTEDFLTSDHPVALCNNLPASSPAGANIGFASRGLLVLFPISPRASLLLTDPEVYKVAADKRHVTQVTKAREVIELNLTQCFNAHENLYFASAATIRETLATFGKRKDSLRAPAPAVTETEAISLDGRRGILLSMPAPKRRMTLPKAVELRRAARTDKYKLGDAFRRDPPRIAVVQAELVRLQKLREKATAEAEAKKAAEVAE